MTLTHLAYFKLQAKNLFRDYKTQYVCETNSNGVKLYAYKPKYFNVDGIYLDFEFDEEKFSLMKAQHIIALMIGFKSWSDILKASDVELEIAKLLFDNQDIIGLEDWEMYIEDVEDNNNISLNPEAKLSVFKEVVLNWDTSGNFDQNYRLSSDMRREYNEPPRQVQKVNPGPQITSLPLDKEDRAEFIETANEVFENVMWRMEPRNPEQTRKLWDAEDYVDNGLLTKDMLPISKDYALSLIDAFLVHHALELAAQADRAATSA